MSEHEMAQRTLEVSSRCNLPCNPMGDKQDHCYSNATSKETQERQIPFSELVHPHWFSRLAKSDFEWVAVTTKTTVRVRGRGPITIEGRATAVTEAVALLQRRVERWGSQGDITSAPGSHPHPDVVKYSLCGREAKYVFKPTTPDASSQVAQEAIAGHGRLKFLYQAEAKQQSTTADSATALQAGIRGSAAASTDVQQFSDDTQRSALLADLVRQIGTTVETRLEGTDLAFSLQTTLGRQLFYGRGLTSKELLVDELSEVTDLGFQEDGNRMKARFCSALHPAQLQRILNVAQQDLRFSRKPTQERLARTYLCQIDNDTGYQLSGVQDG
ncbi:hypothetical protein ABBQ38_006967 [Trebouxia sp. C0009 RCD-2024]